jgi:ribosomal protein S6
MITAAKGNRCTGRLGPPSTAYLIQKLAKAHYLCINIEASQAVMEEIEHAFTQRCCVVVPDRAQEES